MDYLATILAFLISFSIVLVTTPSLIKKMKEGGMVGRDINKKGKPEVPELGGIATLFAFSISLSIVVGIKKLTNFTSEPPYLAAISVFFIASMIGLIDDISDIKQRVKAAAVLFASLPLLLVHYGDPIIQLPLNFEVNFSDYYLLYWLILVPIGVTGVANAMNMSAGYNGLESGQIAVISSFLILVAVLRGAPEVSILIFVSLLGCSLGLYYFNRYPARIFVGDIGTLGMGAAIAAGVIIGHIEFFGAVAIAPAFYEAVATLYYGPIKKNGKRREACHNPVIHQDGTLSPPNGGERYSLAYFLLSKRPMTEKKLVNSILLLYGVSGAAALILSVV